MVVMHGSAITRVLVVGAVLTAATPVSVADDCDYGPSYDPAVFSCVGGSAAGDPCTGWGDPQCIGGSCELGPGGQATYYSTSGEGNCAFDPLPPPAHVAAIAHDDYDDSAACGTCLMVTGPLGSVLVKVTDRCPECPAGNLDLSTEAFNEIADPAHVRVPVAWETVPCPVAGNAVAINVDGANQWWYGVHIDDHRHGIASVEMRSDTYPDWFLVTRTLWNAFLKDDGLGPAPLDLRITDVTGAVLVADDAIQNLTPRERFDLGAQFPVCEECGIFCDDFETGFLIAWSGSTSDDVLLTCPSAVDEHSPIDCAIDAVGPNTCLFGSGHTCGGSLTGCTSFHRDAFGEDNPTDCLVEIDKGSAQASAEVVIDEINDHPSWSMEPSDINLFPSQTYDQLNGLAIDGDIPNALPSDPGYVRCELISHTCSFTPTVSGTGPGSADCHLTFTAGGPDACTITIHAVDGMLGTSPTSVIDVEVQAEAVSLSCPASVDEHSPIDCTLNTIGPSACVVGPNDTCGGVLTACSAYHRDAFGEDNPPSCEIDVIKGGDRDTRVVFIDEVNQTPVWSVSPFGVTVDAGEAYDGRNARATDGDLPSSSGNQPGYLRCQHVADDCSFEAEVVGTGSGEVDCQLSFIAGRAETCDIDIEAVDGFGASLSGSISVTVVDPTH